MTDDELNKIDQLLDKKFSAMRQDVATDINALGTKLTAQIDTVAAHLAKANEKLDKAEEARQVDSQRFESVNRNISGHTDRLDAHHERIAVVEAKTSHLPTKTK